MGWTFAFIAVVSLTIFPGASIAGTDHSTSKRVRHKTRVRHRSIRSRHSSKHRAKHRSHRRSRRRTSQLHPTAERYKQIQTALASKGYYQGDIDGKWGPDSIYALQQFQTDCGIENEGKITALALIGLGLGPKHMNALRPGASSEKGSAASDSEISEGEHARTAPQEDQATGDPPGVN